MRKGHNPNVRQCKLLTENGKDYTKWLVVKTEIHQITFRHKTSGEVITLKTTQ